MIRWRFNELSCLTAVCGNPKLGLHHLTLLFGAHHRTWRLGLYGEISWA
ncbi:unnamed protein product, partial [Brassica oleracea var. botrytis]